MSGGMIEFTDGTVLICCEKPVAEDVSVCELLRRHEEKQLRELLAVIEALEVET